MKHIRELLFDGDCRHFGEKAYRAFIETIRRAYFPIIDAVVASKGIDALIEAHVPFLRELNDSGLYGQFQGDPRGKLTATEIALKEQVDKDYPRLKTGYHFTRVQRKKDLQRWSSHLLEQGEIPFTESKVRRSTFGGFDVYEIKMLPSQPHDGLEKYIRAWIYQPRERESLDKRPGMNILPILGNAYPMGHVFASIASSREGGFVSLVADKTREVERWVTPTRKAFGVDGPADALPGQRHLVAKYRQLTDFLRQRLDEIGADSTRLARVGWSLGGLIGASLTVMDPVDVHCIALAGGPLEQMMLDTDNEFFLKRVRNIHRLEEFAEWLADGNFPLDGTRIGRYADPSKIIMIESMQDEAVRPNYQENLRRALGYPETLTLPATSHKGALIPPVLKPINNLLSMFGYGLSANEALGNVMHATLLSRIREKLGMVPEAHYTERWCESFREHRELEAEVVEIAQTGS